MPIKSSLNAASVLLVTSSVGLQADTLYDESVSGAASLSDPFESLPPDAYDMFGTLEGSGVHTLDIYTFTAVGAWSLDVSLDARGAKNDAIGLAVARASPSTYQDVIDGTQVGGPVADLFSGRAGTFRFLVNEFGRTSPATHALRLFVVQLP